MRESTQPLTDIRGPFKDRYELVGLVGEGGFGQVYKARQLTTDQEVAIKILRLPAGGAENQLQKQLARFRREMRICSRLFHPNIVRPIDSGQTEDGRLFSVFEFVPGETLADVLAREGALDPREVLRLMNQVLDALDCAHRRGVVHRDIKPQNIMITDTGARRNALVLDFGLSTLADELSAGEVSGISSIFEIQGTPAYAAPEQLRGLHPDMRSDLYSWGLVYLECLTGERVMSGHTLQEVVEKQLGPEPVRIPEALEGLRLGELLRQVMVKDIDKRSVTAAGLLRELEACSLEEGSMVVRRFAVARTRSAPVSKKGSKAATPLSEGHLRQITALCCGVNVLALRPEPRGMDIEERDSVLRTQQNRCIEIAEELGGYLGGVLGQEVMFYFGYPTAREDAPRSAARAALRLLEEAATWKAQVEAQHGLLLEVRLGLHTGVSIIRDPLAQERQDFPSVLGTTPTLAIQLQEMAEPDEALVSQDAHRLLRNDFMFESVRRVEPRTFRQVEVSRLGQTRAQDLSLPEPPLVGRKAEMDLLLGRWTQVRQGVGQGILITGEPGIGKSRLVRELSRKLSGTPHSLLECRCAPEDRGSALRPIIELLKHLLGRSGDGSTEHGLAELEALLTRYGFELEEAVPLFASLLSIPLGERYQPPQATPEWQKALTFDAVLNLLVEMAAQQPVLLAIEDLQWADSTTLELLAFLLDSVPTARLGVIFTARPEFIPPWGTSQTFHLQVGRLDSEGVEEMIRGLTRGKALPEEVARQVASWTDGIPLFVEELTRMVLDTGALQEDEQQYRRVEPFSRLTIPGTLRSLLEARLDRAGRAKETAELASLLGREFSYEMLRAISPRDERSLQADLATLVASDLLQHRRKLRDPGYVFKHALIREAAYDSIPRSTRRELHARVASVLEERFPAFVADRPEVLAQHFAAADLRTQALEYVQRAAQKALMRSAHAEAITHAHQALEWLEALPEQGQLRMERELEILGILVPALMAARGWTDEEVEERLRRSQELVDRLGDSPYTAQALWGLLTFRFSRGELKTSRTLAERLIAQGERLHDPGLQGLALTFLGELCWLEGQSAKARELLESALALYDPVRHREAAHLYGLDPRACAETRLGLVHCMTGELDQAQEHLLLGIEWSREIRHPFSEGLALMDMAGNHFLRGEDDQVHAIARQGIELATRHGLSVIGTYFRIYKAWAEKDPESLELHLRVLREAKMLVGFSGYLALLADAEAAKQEYLSALQHIQEGLRFANETGEIYLLPLLFEVRARILLGRGEREPAEESLRAAKEEAQVHGVRMLELRVSTALCRLLMERGEGAQEREALSLLLKKFPVRGGAPLLQQAKALALEVRKEPLGEEEARKPPSAGGVVPS